MTSSSSGSSSTRSTSVLMHRHRDIGIPVHGSQQMRLFADGARVTAAGLTVTPTYTTSVTNNAKVIIQQQERREDEKDVAAGDQELLDEMTSEAAIDNTNDVICNVQRYMPKKGQLKRLRRSFPVSAGNYASKKALSTLLHGEVLL